MSVSRTKAKGERKREILMVVDVNAAKGKLFQKLREGLEESKELQLENFRQFGAKVEGGFAPSVKAIAYKQRNLDATRKVVAPLVQTIVEGA
jgi:exopolyphosphatase